jgi:pantothenate kinase
MTVGPKTHDNEPPRITASATELAARLRERVASASERVIIGICGAPGAGKSTLAALLAAELGPQLAAVVPFDGFHLATAALDGTELLSRRGAIDTFDLGSYRALVHRLRVRDEDVVYAPSYRRGLEEPIASSIAVPRSVPLVLTEGNYLLTDVPDLVAVREDLDEVWYLDIPDEARVRQLVARHIAFGKSDAEAAAWAAGTDQRNADRIEQTRHRADLIVTLGG